MIIEQKANDFTQQQAYEKIFEFLRNKFGSCYSNSEYYREISVWGRIYKGFDPSYHTIVSQTGVSTSKRNSAVLKMGKRVAEDWSAILMADKPIITINAKNKAVSRFVQGSRGTGGVLGSNNFNKKFSDAVERAFAMGSTAIVLGILYNENAEEKYKMQILTYNANAIFPIRYEDGIISECAFLSSFYKEGKKHYNLSCHVKNEAGEYIIYNYESSDDLNFSTYLNKDVDGLETRSTTPFFFIISPQKSNNIDIDCPLGVSIYADAIDIILGCDFMFDALRQDVYTGQRIILMDKSLLGVDENGRPCAPQDFKKWCMQFVGDEMSTNMENVIKDFSPQLHTGDLVNSLQQNLNLLSMRCGLGSNYYQFDKTAGVTATEYTGSQQDLVRNARTNIDMLINVLTNMIKQILWTANNIFGYALDQNASVDIIIPDGVVTNDAADKEQDRADVAAGLMTKVEYRMKWYGENENTAKQKVAEMEGKVDEAETTDNDEQDTIQNKSETA